MVPDLDKTSQPPETTLENAGESRLQSPGSSSVSTTPPIELIAMAEGDSDDSNSAAPGSDIADQGLLLLDPTTHFPYAESDESLCDTLQRLSQYISTSEWHRLARPCIICAADIVDRLAHRRNDTRPGC